MHLLPDPLGALLEAARAGAGAVRRATEGGPPRFRRKPDGSILSEADEAAHDAICASLLANLSNVDIVSEERAMSAIPDPPPARLAVVDPLDGTTNFSRGIPLYAVSIGLVDSGVAVAGVVLDLPSGTAYAGVRGRGAWRIAGDGPRRISRGRQDLSRAIVSLGCDMGDEGSRATWSRWLAALLPPTCFRVRMLECAAMELCWVAEGLIDAYVHPSNQPWDMSAGGLIVSEAGGEVFGPHGRAWLPLERGIVALAPGLAAPVLRRLGLVM
jgi:myo-inositol-1(or 4)-monophosphatase